MLILQDFTVSREHSVIITVPTLTINPGELHILSAPNGSGKSSLAWGIMGHPDFSTVGSLLINGTDAGGSSLEHRAQQGLFVSYQHPLAIPGLSVRTYFLEICRAQGVLFKTGELFEEALGLALNAVGLSMATADRALYDGFSGGERKRLELAHLLLLKPRVAILDEIDSGLDADGVMRMISIVEQLLAGGMAILFITHDAVCLRNRASSCWTIAHHQLIRE